MAITKMKLIRARTNRASRDGRTAVREYRLWHGTTAEAEAHAGANIPASIVTFDGVTMDIESLEVAADENLETFHNARVEYSSSPRSEPSDIGTETVSFRLSPQVIKQTQSLQTMGSFPAAGETAPDFKGGIAFADGKFEGVDRYVEAFTFTVSKVLANSSITNAYIQTLRDCAFRWNAAPYRGMPAGEVLFMGAAGSPRDAKSYTMNYDFMCSKNASGLTSGGISGITKQGHDVLWHFRQEIEDTTAKIVVKRPIAAYVERVYLSASFQTALGLL